jgi:hypothetical protein
VIYADDNVQYALEKLAKEDESGFRRIGKGSVMGATALGGAGLAGGAYAGLAGRKAAMGALEEIAQEAFPDKNVGTWSDKKMRQVLSKEWKAGTLVDRLDRASGHAEKGLSESARKAAMFRRFNPFKHVGRMPMYAALATGAIGAGLGASIGSAGGAAYHGAASGHRRLTRKK